MKAENPHMVDESTKVCFRFAYFLYGEDHSMVNLKVLSSSSESSDQKSKILFRSYDEITIKWHEAYIDLTIDENSDHFEINGLIHQGILAIDDIKVTIGECVTQELECDFESDISSMFKPSSSWRIWKGADIGINDHTTDTKDGHFYGIFKEAKSKEIGTFSTVTTKKAFDDYSCLRFSYYLMGNRNVSLSYLAIDVDNELIFGDSWEIIGANNLNGQVGWMTHQATISNPGDAMGFRLQMKIEILAVSDNEELGVFIDDISIYPGECTSTGGDCDFEDDDACSLEILRSKPNDEFTDDWKIQLANRENLTELAFYFMTNYIDSEWHVYCPRLHGPYIDHDFTYDSIYGNYLLFVSHHNVERGIILTERYDTGGSENINFCLSMAIVKPCSDSYLEIYQAESFSSSAKKLFGTNFSTKEWRKIEIQTRRLNAASKDIYFFIIATVTNNDYGRQDSYVAIDNFSFKKSSCNNPDNPLPYSTTTTTTTTLSSISTTPIHGFHDHKFYCDPSQVISVEKVCNYHKDCPDGLDELECGSCDIRPGYICGYENEATVHSFRWRLTKESECGPHDQLENSLTAYGSITTPYQDNARLISPIIHQSYGGCRYSFFYLFHSKWKDSNDRFALKLKIQDGNELLLWDSGMQLSTAFEMNEWHRIDYWLGRIPHSFQLILRASPLGPYVATSTYSESYHSVLSFKMEYCDPPKPMKEDETCNKFLCANNVCIDEANVCDFEDDCGDGSDENGRQCDFTNRMTDFQDDNDFGRWGDYYRINWRIEDVNSFNSFRQGPGYDHTLRYASGGRVLFTDTDKENNEAKMSIIDGPPMLIPATASCIVRMFVLKNSKNSTLFLKLWDLETGQTHLLATLREDRHYFDRFYYVFGNQDNRWNGTYKILIEAELRRYKGEYLKPYIAIDDISFSNDCHILTEEPVNLTTIAPDHFCDGIWCENEKQKLICVPASEICDFIPQCRDGLDELQCGDCTFNLQSSCRWESQVETNGHVSHWDVYDPASNAPDPLPTRDGQQNPMGGYYGFIFDSNKQETTLKSPTINGRTDGNCKFSFRLMTSLETTISLYVNDHFLCSFLITERNEWNYYTTDFGERFPSFNLFFAISSFRMPGDKRNHKEFIAVDDIRFLNCTKSNHDDKPESIKKLNCDFETDFCGWKIINDYHQQQQLNWFRTNRPDIEPGEDHTSHLRPLPRKHGTWLSDSIKIMMDNGDGNRPRQSILKTASPINGKKNDYYCFTFWYYFFGISSATLNVKMMQFDNHNNVTQTQTLWRRTRPQTRNWQPAWIELQTPSDKDFDLIIESLNNGNSIAGIDDIGIMQGKCSLPSKEFCDFEINECAWKPLAGHLKRCHNCQTRDHTTGSTAGHYLALPLSGDSDTMISSLIQSIESLSFFPEDDTAVMNPLRRYDLCINLYYYFQTLSELNLFNIQQQTTARNVQLSLQIQENNYRSTLKNVSLDEIISINQQNKWTSMSVSFTATKKASIIMQITQSSNQDTMILIDDVRFVPHFCDSLHGNCNFETDMCGWYNGIDQNQDATDNRLIYWIRVQPRNEIVRHSGCWVDHTLGRPDGNYLALPLDMYRQSSSAHAESVLRGPIMNRPKNEPIVCFRMYYFANSVDQNITTAMTLRVLDLHKNGAIAQEFNIYTQTHDPIVWMPFTREIRKLPMVYSFEIVAKYNDKIASDLGIDDITITQGHCWNNSDSSPAPSPTTEMPQSERIADCNFEHECHWTFYPKIWTITSYLQRHDQYAPPLDHTLKHEAGHYILFINDTNQLNETTQYLVAPPMIYDKERCLTFWYYADGSSVYDVGRLDFAYSHGNVNILGKKWIQPFARLRFLRTQSWRLHRITIPFVQASANDEKILIRMNFSLSEDIPSSSKGVFNSFAIDDIQIRPGRCKHLNDYTYTFTNGLDGLQLEQIQPLDEMDAYLFNFPTFDANHQTGLFPLTIPHNDHTTFSTTDGYYLGFMNKKTKKLQIDYIDRLSIENVPADVSQRSCVRFAYKLVGNVSLSVYWSAGEYFDDYHDRHNDHLLWATNSEKPWWTVVEFDKQLDFEHRIVFEIIKPTSNKSYLVLDDLIVMNSQCERPIDCDFNHDDYCSYSDYYTKSGQAFRLYATWTSNFHPDFPGPRLDHSQIEGNGFLMLSAWRWSPDSIYTGKKYAEIISGAQRIERGRIYCLEIWAWINDAKASVEILLLRFQRGHSSGSRILGRILEVQHDRWTPYYFTIGHDMLETDIDEIQILIEGVVIKDPKTMIALDDISFHQGRCQNESIKCLNGKIIKPEQQCDFRKDCPSGWDEIGCGDECNFEKDDCGWKDTGSIDRDYWFHTSVQEMQSWSPSYAPKFDANANKKGHFMMMRRWIGGRNSQSGHAEMALNARKMSLYFKHSSADCLIEFDYYAQASKAFFLKVRFGDEINNMNTFYMIANTIGTTHGSWTRQYGHIGLHWTPFIVEFDVFDQSTQSAIAVDNIKFIECAMDKPLSHGQNCSLRLIMCNQTRICIRPDSLCDGINDCGEDGEDESIERCGSQLWRRCSFESWSQCQLDIDHVSEVHAHWRIVTGHEFEDNQLNPGYEPLIDNTRRSRLSPYALLVPGRTDDQNTHHRFRYASIYTPFLSSKVLNMTNPCRLGFYYYWHTDIGRVIDPRDLSLEVFVRYQDDDDDCNNENEIESTSHQPKILWSITASDVLDQQRWYKSVVAYPDPNDNDWIDHWNNNHEHNLTMKPFQFVLRGWIHEDEHSRLAIDDLSYGFNCIAEETHETTTSPTNQPITGSTDQPVIHNHKGSKVGTGIFFVTIFIAMMIIVIVVVARRQYYRHYHNRNDLDNLVVSLKHLDEQKSNNQIEIADEAIEQQPGPSASAPVDDNNLVNDDQQTLDNKILSEIILPPSYHK
nr:MAM and LDL-receptor class A domain-containing protein 1-like [Dermatophagoides farinae]